MTPRLVPFRLIHLDQMNSPRGANYDGPAFTAIVNDRPIVSAGMIILWPGVGHAWVVIGDIKGHGLWVTRTVKRVLGDIIRGCELHRVEATVLTDAKEHHKWVKLFGFEPEGVAHEFTATRLDATRYEFIVDKPTIVKKYLDGFVMFEARVRGHMVGYASHSYTPAGYAYGCDMYVEEDFRRKGIGSALHRARLLEAKRHGARFFVGMSDNPAMINILESCGALRCDSDGDVTYVCELR